MGGCFYYIENTSQFVPCGLHFFTSGYNIHRGYPPTSHQVLGSVLYRAVLDLNWAQMPLICSIQLKIMNLTFLANHGFSHKMKTNRKMIRKIDQTEYAANTLKLSNPVDRCNHLQRNVL